MRNKVPENEVEILVGCRNCGSLPRLSAYTFEYKNSFNYSCCIIGLKANSIEEAAAGWNARNLSSNKVYKLNKKTATWELVTNGI